MFKNAKVASCSQVLAKNGLAVCIGFNNGAPKLIDINNRKILATCSYS